MDIVVCPAISRGGDGVNPRFLSVRKLEWNVSEGSVAESFESPT